jgi:uncharacterized protein YjbI with pentapeptide repeats
VSFNDVDLSNAKISGQISLVGASFSGTLVADFLQVGGSLLMYSDDQNTASFKDVVLSNAKITGQISLVGASFSGTLGAGSLQASDLIMRSDNQNKASFKDVDLHGGKIAGQIDMTGASFGGALNAEGLDVGSSLLMRGANYAQKVDMVFAHIGGNLDLRGSTLAGLDLSGASVSGDLRLHRPYKSPPRKGNDRELGDLNLRNARTGSLVDEKDAWPARGHLHLEGFNFNHLGGFGGETGQEMRARGMEWWDKNWARLDPDYSPAPYTQLAAVFTNMGDRDAANEIRYRSRVRERETEKGLAYVWSGFLQWVAGFGIGTYTFRALYWVLGISLLGSLYLRTRVQGVRDEKHGFI